MGKAAVKIGSPIKPRIYPKIKRYINHNLYKFKLWTAKIVHDYQIRIKSKQILIWVTNVTITGALIYYIINNNDFIAYGLALVMFLYYLDIVVQIIKKPHKDK